MNGRVMDASIGRFLSPDPYLTEPGNTQNFNRYSYVVNNPLSYIDPTGFAGCTPDPTAIANICGHKPTPNSAPYAPHTDSWSEYCFYLSYAGFYSPMCDPPSGGGGGIGVPTIAPIIPLASCPDSIVATCKPPKVCTAAEASAHKKRVEEKITENTKKGLVLGLGASDIAFTTAEKLTKGLSVPRGVDLQPIKVVGGGLSLIGIGYSSYQVFTAENRNERALAAQDTMIALFGLRYPQLAAFTAFPYGIGRLLRDSYDAVTSVPSTLEKLAVETSGCP
jgi:hypothetical protein